MKHLSLLTVLALLPANSGCCSLSRIFCGPDQSEWVSVSYDSPEATLATLLEAVRRENPTQVYFCLSRSYLRELGGDGLAMNLVYPRMLDQFSYLHLLGYAKIPPQPSSTSPGAATYDLVVQGQKLRIDLVRQTYWVVRYRDANGSVHESSRVLDGDTFHDRLDLQSAGYHPLDDVPISQIEMSRPLSFEHSTSDHPLPLDRIDFLGLGREWKVSRIDMPQ